MGDRESSGFLRTIVIISLISMLAVFGASAIIVMAAPLDKYMNQIVGGGNNKTVDATQSNLNGNTIATHSTDDLDELQPVPNPDYDMTLNADQHTEWWFIYNDAALTATLGGYWGPDLNLVIPSKVIHNGKTYVVTGVNGSNSMSSRGYTSVKMPNTITWIGQGAFADNKLQSISLSNNLTKIDDFAFTKNNITGQVTIPNGVKVIGYNTFSHNHISGVYFNHNVSDVSDFAFYGNSVKSIYIPDSVSSIGLQSFSENPLTKVSVMKDTHVADKVATDGIKLIHRN